MNGFSLIEYALQRANEKSWEGCYVRPYRLHLKGGETFAVKAVRFFVLVSDAGYLPETVSPDFPSPYLGIRVESENGVWDPGNPDVKESTYEHEGLVTFTNQAATPRHMTLLRVYPKRDTLRRTEIE